MRWGAILAFVLIAALPPAEGLASSPQPDSSLSKAKKTKVAEVVSPERRKPGPAKPNPPPIEQINPGAVESPPPEAFPLDEIPVPDRWRITKGIAELGVDHPWYDPYDQNTFKADRPLPGTDDWFVNFSAISDTVVEPHSTPLPVGTANNGQPSNNVFGRTNQLGVAQILIGSASLIEGSTAFKPPDIEVRLTLAFNANYAEAPEEQLLSIKSSRAPDRFDEFLGVQEAFVDYHIRNVSDRYDFDSIRIGIQPFSSDFRGFLFQDNQLGVRLFGDRDDNRWQYNLAFFDLLEKDIASGLNDVSEAPRKDYVAVANLYRQDLPVPGFTSQVTAVYNADREGGEVYFDSNGFPQRPALIGDDLSRNYDVVYLGYNGDGHIDRVNLTASAYYAIGQDRNNVFTNRAATISSWFAAAEPSYDWNWIRVRLSGLYASGNSNPYGNTETGFDAIFENPQFAGADTSYWIRQSVPFVGGGTDVFVNSRNGVLNDLRSSKELGQSNFNNPGTALVGAGADFDVLPQLRVSTNINHLWFADTTVVDALRQQCCISNDLGWDYSLSTIWRPLMTQNIVLRASAAVFEPTGGFNDLFPNTTYYSILFNATLTY
jgi:hypothetical protein